MTRECRGHFKDALVFVASHYVFVTSMSMYAASERSCTASLVPAQEAQRTALRYVHALLGAHAIAADGTPCASLDAQAQPPSCRGKLAHMPLAALSQAVLSSKSSAHYVDVLATSEFDATECGRMVHVAVPRGEDAAWSMKNSSV